MNNSFNNHIAENAQLSHSQFGYKTHHSKEMMMVGVLNGFDNNQCTIIIFLDLSAAFDTIDQNKLGGNIGYIPG